MESLALQLIAVIFGASIGSFLNVVIYRLPAGLSLLHPPSRCPHCLRKLAPRDNIPVLGWFLIKGKCRYCHSPVSWRYPLIEALTAFLFWSVAISFDGKPLVLIIFYCLFLSWLIALSVIDIDTMTLPNALTQSGLVLGVIYQVSRAVAVETPNMSIGNQIVWSVLGAVVGIWLIDLIRFLGQLLLQTEAMGAGDAKLAAMIGAWLGWQNLLLTVLIAAILGSLVGAFIIGLNRLGKKQPFAFGPFLAIAATCSLFWGNVILNTYLSWFGFS